MTQPEDPPVSVKVALRSGTGWVLLRNDRNEWELPGGRVDAIDETLQDTARRECREELGIEVDVGPLVDAYLFEVVPGQRVTIVCFAATVPADVEFVISAEHRTVGVFTTADLQAIELPTSYRSAILKAQNQDV